MSGDPAIALSKCLEVLLSTRNAAPARGTKDILPREAQLRSWAISRLLETYSRHGFSQIEVPIIESIEWLTGGIGGENEKLLFKILKRGEKLDLANVTSEDDLCDLALRFDLTVPLTRYFANNQALLPQPFKAIQIGPVFRAERPQKGRFRQFTQCDIDILGESSYLGEIELIAASAEALMALSLRGFEIKINDRRALEAFSRYCGFIEGQSGDFFITLDKLDKIGIEGVAKELSAKAFAADSIDKAVDLVQGLSDGRNPLDFYSETGVAEAVLSQLEKIASFSSDLGGTSFSTLLDPTIVRGMGYYTGTVFEVSYPGWSSSIAGGGRYDKMLERYGKESPAVGFSLGFERVLSILLEQDDLAQGVSRRYVTIVFQESDDLKAVFQLATFWREAGYSVSLAHRKAKLGNQLKRLEAEANAARHPGDFFGVMVYGEDREPREL